VMIIDDSRAMRRIQRNVVSELGDVEIIEAEDGIQAAEQLKDHGYQVDLILLDWIMPRMDGLTLAKILKKNDNLRRIPILMVTSVSDEHKIREAWRTGVDGVLLKPFTKEMLLQSILALQPGRLKDDQIANMLEKKGGGESSTFLDELPQSMYNQILDLSQKIIMPERTAFLLQGMPVNQFYFVLEGMVEEHVTTAESNSTMIRKYGPGECFAVNELMSDDVAPNNFIVSDKSKVAYIPKTDFETLLLNHPSLNISLSRYLASKLNKIAMRDGEDHPLHGSLDVLDMPGLVQALNLRQASGVIEFPDIDAKLEILAGQVVVATHPNCPAYDGVLAFFEIVSAKPKKFRLMSKMPVEEHNVLITTPKLLIEAMRWLDESCKKAVHSEK
ncbi:MAG: response regulator, partial [Planctomycetota bacterium]